jgi:hypothetical protein
VDALFVGLGLVCMFAGTFMVLSACERIIKERDERDMEHPDR